MEDHDTKLRELRGIVEAQEDARAKLRGIRAAEAAGRLGKMQHVLVLTPPIRYLDKEIAKAQAEYRRYSEVTIEARREAARRALTDS